PGSLSITVTNPNPTSQTSDAATLTILAQNVAIIQSIDPTQVVAQSGQFTLTVTGTGFMSGARVQWNGSNRITTFVDTQHLTAIILAGDIASAGQASITVANPNGAPVSNALTLFIVSRNGPVIDNINPATVMVGS